MAESNLDTRFFRDVFNASPIGIAVETLDGQPVFVNPALCRFLDLTEEELRGKHYVDFRPKEGVETDWALFQQLRAGSIDHYQLEKRYFRKDGSMVWGRLSISLSSSHPSPLVIAMLEDITDKKKSEELLSRHTAIIESCDEAISSVTLDGVTLTWNAGAQRMFGYTENETVGRPATFFAPPELRDQQKKILETLRAGGRIAQLETVRVSKAGRRINVSLSVSPIKDSAGKIVGCAGIARDITNRKLAEEALRSSERRYRLLFERNVAGVAIASLDGRLLDCNDGWAHVLGYESGDDLLGRHASEFYFNPAERKLLVDELFDKQVLFSRELRLRRKDGTPVWVMLNAAVHSDQDSPIVQATMIDISERKSAEEARFRHAAIVESSEDAIVAKDLNAIITSWNAGARRIFGYTEEEAVGQPITILIPPDLCDEEQAILAKLRAGGRIDHYETVRVTKTGQRVDMSLSISPIRDATGTIVGFSKIARDISARKRSEQTLRESEERLRLATQAGRMEAYDWDVARDEVVRSSEHTTILGLTEPLRFPHQQFLNRVHPDDRPTFLAAIAGLTPVNPTGEVTYRVSAPDGTSVWVKSNGRGFFDRDGKLVRVIGMVADITDFKQAEEAVSAMTRKLIEAQEQERARIARELHDDVSQRLAMLAIELERLKKNPSESGIRVQKLSKQVTDMSDDIQALSHDLHSSSLDYLGAVTGIKSWCRDFAERQGMQIDYRHHVQSTLPGEIGLCLFRVLQEALHNAAKHGGVKRVEVELSESSGNIHLTIRDWGRGFDVEAVKRGKGLGLTSMRERVRLVNGTMAIASRPMGGTTIRVGVPLPSEQGYHRTAV